MAALFDGARDQALRGLRAVVGQALSYRVRYQEIRREAFALGGRHMGQVLVGARLESEAPSLSFRRAVLLKAVIRSESAKAKVPGGGRR
ncbi:MAG TPA: hypothetical protein VG960_12670 [Caulobacteraceae bacterium]|nr:hypothetical protein [Caulobacteraceae bacterium]